MMSIRNSNIKIFTFFLKTVIAVISLSSYVLAQEANTSTTGGTQWGSFNNRLDGQRYSPLSQITPENADEVGEICRIRIDGPTAFTSGLIEIDGVIYATTGRQTVAVNASDCTLIWRHTYIPDDLELRPSNRGPAILDGRLFRGTGDGRLIALDVETGELIWKNHVGNPHLAEFVSGAPLAWQGMVFAATAGGDSGIRGRIMAFDAVTGRELWRFNTIPMGEETGAETWERPETAKTGGGGVWGVLSLDVMTRELFVPVGNPWPDIDADYRPGDNLFTNSIVVLDAITGELKWWHQAVPADSHDMDLAAAPVLYRNNNIQDVMVYSGKDGYVRAINRDSLEEMFKVAVTRTENEGIPATEEGTYICPGFAGGTGWNGPALDTQNNHLVIGSRVGGCMTLYTAPTVYDPPNVEYGGLPVADPDSVESGAITALDADTGQVKWVTAVPGPVIAGVSPTAGGVTFFGDQNGDFMILNSEDGKILHSVNAGGALAGGVITYEMEGEQYIALAAGNLSRFATAATAGFPSIVIMGLNPSEASQEKFASDYFNQANTELMDPDWTRGRGLYEQICSSCHGPNGDSFSDHTLSDINQRFDNEQIIELIKKPNLPMPTLYPDMLTEQNVLDLSSFLSRGVL